MEYKYFAGIRVKGQLTKSEKYSGVDYIDMNISKEEAERIVKFLSNCLDKEKINGI